MKITILGTGNAQVTECYNTCYVLSSEEGSLLVDGGGGVHDFNPSEAGWN